MKDAVPQLIICGAGPLEQTCKKYVRKNGLEEYVHFAGHLSHEDVLREMANVKALIFPARCYETFGMTIIEAISVGTPVIVSDTVSLSKEVRKLEMGSCIKANKTDELVGLIKTYQGTFKMAVNQEKQIRESYAPKGNYSMLYNIYSKVMIG